MLITEYVGKHKSPKQSLKCVLQMVSSFTVSTWKAAHRTAPRSKILNILSSPTDDTVNAASTRTATNVDPLKITTQFRRQREKNINSGNICDNVV